MNFEQTLEIMSVVEVDHTKYWICTANEIDDQIYLV